MASNVSIATRPLVYSTFRYINNKVWNALAEYIDNSIQESEQVGMSGYDCALYLKNSMRTVRSMLDELKENNK